MKENKAEQKQNEQNEQINTDMTIFSTAVPQEYVVAEELGLPPFVKPDTFPIGAVLIGRVDKIIGDFTGNPDMEDCQNLVLTVLANNKQIMFPVTGEMKQMLLSLGDDSLIGKVIALKRNPDKISTKYKNKQFSFSGKLLKKV